jgi:hypothetical protein
MTVNLYKTHLQHQVSWNTVLILWMFYVEIRRYCSTKKRILSIQANAPKLAIALQITVDFLLNTNLYWQVKGFWPAGVSSAQEFCWCRSPKAPSADVIGSTLPSSMCWIKVTSYFIAFKNLADSLSGKRAPRQAAASVGVYLCTSVASSMTYADFSRELLSAKLDFLTE